MKKWSRRFLGDRATRETCRIAHRIPCMRIFQMPFVIGVLVACSSGAGESGTVAPEVGVAVAVDSSIARAVRASDLAFTLRFPSEALELAQAGLPRAGEVLIGRNRSWGRMYASRFQMGTGTALRTTLAQSRAADAARAFDGVEAGFSNMDTSGRLPASVPISVSMGASPRESDVASGAAFFLGDACSALLSLSVSPGAADVVAMARQQLVQQRAARSISWLRAMASTLQTADAAAPNRLLFDARAFLACGRLTPQPEIAGVADAFVRRALALQAPDGWFDESGGWDTSYQAVTLEIGTDVHSLLTAGALKDSLGNALQSGSEWLTSRIDEEGRVNSTGNRRTCSGGESFLGTPKQLSIASVITGLARVTSHVRAVDGAEAAARRVVAWARQHPDGDPCFERTQ